MKQFSYVNIYMRKPRKLQDGARYHVTARANWRELILDHDGIKDLFLNVVLRAKKKYDFRIENFCIMGNHIHFIIQPLNGCNLSKIMQWILSVFAMKWNKIHGTWGHVWGDRFFSQIISTFRGYLEVFRYIDLNPVQADLCKQVHQWHYSGFWHRLKKWNFLTDDPPGFQWMVGLNHYLPAIAEGTITKNTSEC
jgi:REP element-mobilizing transposase RayT